ncbi:hypothetical protein WPG_2731 [Winogradskyella sp. PG-2]|nr:hypothetical protein WPG_2731 [Winogradskyella sp. PG-2]
MITTKAIGFIKIEFFDSYHLINTYCAEKYNALLNDANNCFINQFMNFNKKTTK